MKELIQRITALLYDKKKRKIRNKVGYAVACVVVFITTYALILPAITMEKHVACGIPEHQHSEECYEERLVCGLDEYIPVSDEAGGIDVIAEDDSSGLDVIEDSEPVQGHVHTEACYEKVLVCGMEPHTHSAACYKKQDSSVAENTVDEGPAPQENGSVEGDYIEENESGDELVYEEGAAEEDLSDASLASGQEDIPAEENVDGQDGSDGEVLASGQEDISAEENVDGQDGSDGEVLASGQEEIQAEENVSAQEASDGEVLSSGQEDIQPEENDVTQDVTDGTAAASGDVREETVSGQEGTEETLTGTVDNSVENGLEEDGDTQDIHDEASAQPVGDPAQSTEDPAQSTEDPAQLAENSAPAGSSGDSVEEQSSESKTSVVYLEEEETLEDDQTGETDQGAVEDNETGTSPEQASADEGQTDGTEQGAGEETGADSETGTPQEQASADDGQTGGSDQDADAESGTGAPAAEGSADGAAADNKEGGNAVSEQGTEDGNSLQEPGAAGQEAQTEDPLQGSVSLADYLTGATAVYYSRTAETDGADEWKPVENDTVLKPSDKIRVYLAYQLPAGLLNSTNSQARYMLPEQLWLSDSRVDKINHFMNGMAAGAQDEAEKAALLGAEAIEGNFRPDDKKASESEELISAIVSVENKTDQGGEVYSQELVFKFVPYTVEKNSDQVDKEGTLISRGEAVSGYFALDFALDEITFNEKVSAPSDSTDTSGQGTEAVMESRLVFAGKDEASGRKEISATLRMILNGTDNPAAKEEPGNAGSDLQAENGEEGEDSGKAADNTDKAEESEDNNKEKTDADQTADSEEGKTQDDSEKADEGQTEAAAAAIATPTDFDAAASSEAAQDGKEESSADLAAKAADMPAQTFDESLTVETSGLSAQEGNGGILGFFKRLFGIGDKSDDGNSAGGNSAGGEEDILPSKSVLNVHVEADEGTFPAGTVMSVKAVRGDDLETVSDAISNTIDAETCGFQAVDITFYSPEGKEIEPAKPVRVTFTSEAISAAAQAEQNVAPVVLHVQDDGSASTISNLDASDAAAGDVAKEDSSNESSVTGLIGDPEKASDAADADMTDNADNIGGDHTTDDANGAGLIENTKNENTADALDNAGVQEDGEASGSDDNISIEADEFSIYAIVYTVDFFWEVNGKTYEYTLPGGGFVSFQKLMEILGVVDGTDSGKTADGENSDGENDTEHLNLNDVEVSERTRKFVENVANVKFSSPDLVWVGKVESETKVGLLKQANGLEVRYSAELTDDQIERINAQTVEAGDWALISLQPFMSEEMLTVTMKEGEIFNIRVTDYQISTNVLTTDGKTFKITVTFDDDAEIPTGTELVASEIEQGTDKYLERLGQVWAEINKEYFEVEEMRKNYDESMGLLPDVHYVNIGSARFFDISLIYNGEEIEPKASVHVEINYVNGLKAQGETTPGVVHYVGDNEVDIIDDIKTTILNDEVTSFRYEQDSFSDVGTYVGQEAHDVYTDPELAPSPDPDGTPVSRNINLDEESLGRIIRSSLGAPKPTRAVETEKPSTEDSSELEKPIGHKTLTANKDEDGTEDGTYTLSLSVKGHSSIHTNTETKKSNILVVMDRSSSMITRTVNDNNNFWYYGTWNQNETTFRGDISPASGYQFFGLINGEYVELNVSSSWTNWNNYNLTYNNGQALVNYPQDYPIYVNSKTTRLAAEQSALSSLFSQLMEMNAASGENQDLIEIAVISFGDQRFDKKSWKDETEITEWQSGRDTSNLLNHVKSNRFTSGTNWEEALMYAHDIISAKKNNDGDAEDYYVIFLTDGEPTAIEGNKPGEVPYQGEDNVIAYNAAKDDAKKLVDENYKFYNIFTYRTTESEKYSLYLTNYAYGNVDYNQDATTDAVKNYFTDAQTVDSLRNAFDNILLTIVDSIGHGNVSITDTLTTDAMTTTVVHGKTNGYVYEVKDGSGTVLYTVTATGDLDNPAVTFHVPSSSTEDYIASSSDVGGKKVYYVNTIEGKLYKIALADVNDQTGELVWDLSSVGLLMDDCTYSVSFIVWPDQEAYDYVAALNNHLDGYTWSKEAETYEDLLSTKGYEKGGVERYPSIVKKSDGTFAVLTNTDQKIHYSVIETTSDGVNTETTVNGPFFFDLETPDPMPLTATASQIEKIWNVERDPGILAQLLYDFDGNSKEYSILFDILQGSNTTPYTSVSLGWDDSTGTYVWDPNGEKSYTFVNRIDGQSHTVQIGTRWVNDFSIATGLMLSTERMDALGLDKTAYPSAAYNGEMYYILEDGHDYTIKEPSLTYEFDFSSPLYHPMLVDGVLTSVNFKTENGTTTILKMETITTDIDGVSSLKVENTLRGYINLNKVVVDKDGVTPVADDTKFEYKVVLENPKNPGPFTVEGSHVPWYGISGLFYHDAEYNYYQAEPNGEGFVTLTDEDGNIYEATCEGTFAEDVGPEAITFTDSNGVTKTIQLYGNQMDWTSDNHVSATLKITQNQTLNIANVPVGTTYTISEVEGEGHDFLRIRREIRNGSSVEDSFTTSDSATISDTIVANRDNHITYTNKIHSMDITVKKVDENNLPLSGAIFTLTKIKSGNEVEDTVYTKPGDGETDTGTYVFADLPDGSYTLHETPPTGYTAVDDVSFIVADGEISGSVVTPEGVTWDGHSLTLTVVNTPIIKEGEITIRKQWLDFYGNAGTPGANEVNVTLKRKVDTNRRKKLHLIIKVGNTTYKEATWDIENESANVSWYDHNQYSWHYNRMTITQSTGLTVTGNTVGGGNSKNAIFVISNLNTAVGDELTVTFNYENPTEDWFKNDIRNTNVLIEGRGNPIQSGNGEPVDDNWTDTITLNTSNNWSVTRKELPLDDGHGHAYHYYIEESEIEGYTVTYSENNETGITSGVLTAYNRKNTVDLILEKVDKYNRSARLNGATFVLRQLDPAKDGNIKTRSLTGGRMENQTTSGEGSKKGTLVFDSLDQGYYEVKETVAPDGYILEEDSAFYFRMIGSNIELLEKDESKPAEQWNVISSYSTVTLNNATATIINAPGAALPHTGGPGTRIFMVLGGLFLGLGGLLLIKRHRLI